MEENRLRHNLPYQLSSFVGHEQDIIKIEKLLTQSRLVTLTGPGGVGKTRLALTVADKLLAGYQAGVWLVELAPLTDPGLLVQFIAQVFGVREQPPRPLFATLVDYLQDKPILLLLDNCEHLIQDCARLSQELQKNCPNLQILATSREALRVQGEILFEVPSLSLPTLFRVETDPVLHQKMSQAEATALFIERVRAFQPNFEANAQNALTIYQICRRLDGIPLALELAAARVRTLSLDQLARRLDNRFNLLTRGNRTDLPRQQTLRALIDWSYNLLSGPEKVLFRRLAVFAGGWSLEAAEEVCADPYLPAGAEPLESSRILDLLDQLVSKSLIQVSYTEEPYYRFLETIREYSREKLEAGRETGTLCRRHYDYFYKLAAEIEPALVGPNQGQMLAKFEREHDNFRAALVWAFDNNRLDNGPLPASLSPVTYNRSAFPKVEAAYSADPGVRLACLMWRFWHAHYYHLNEGIAWLEKARDRLKSRQETGTYPHLYAKVLQGLAVLLSSIDFERSLSYQEENLAICRASGDLPQVANALNDLGWVYLMHRLDLKKVKAYAEESLSIAHRFNEKALIAKPLFLLVQASQFEGDLAQAARLCQECLVLWRELGDQSSVAAGVNQLGLIFILQKRFEQARPLLREGLELHQKLGNPLGIMISVLGLSQVAIMHLSNQESLHRGVKLLGAAQKMGDMLLAEQPQFSKITIERARQAARQRLTEPVFENLITEGYALSPEEGGQLAYLVASESGASEEPATPVLPDGLTQREVEVLKLVAAGLSNIQIAEKMVLSVRTIEAHLRSIYTKLEITSRSAATRYAFEKGLA
jgi:non-specific serine/threonine protein kinase